MQNFLGEEREAQVSCSVEVLGSKTGIPKFLKKIKISCEEVAILEFRRPRG